MNAYELGRLVKRAERENAGKALQPIYNFSNPLSMLKPPIRGFNGVASTASANQTGSATMPQPAQGITSANLIGSSPATNVKSDGVAGGVLNGGVLNGGSNLNLQELYKKIREPLVTPLNLLEIK